MPEWISPERGYYIAKYRGRTLEIVRNKDATDKRRYVVQVDGVILSHPCHTIPQAKTKAMKWVDTPAVNGPGNGAVIPYTEPPVPALTGTDVMMEFRIVGKIPADQFAHAIAHLKATVDMLRDEGAIAACDIEPPPKVRL